MTEQRYAHRVVNKKIKFTDAQGKPIADRDIAVNQTNHQFLFGCGAFDTLMTTLEITPEIQKAIDEGKFKYDKKIFEKRVDESLKLYNYGTLPFYWGQFEYIEGKPETESRMRAAKFLQENNVKVKGHPLCWHTVCADWLMKYDNATILSKQLDRINREVSDFKGVVDMWDVINEVVIMPVFDKYDNAVTRICKDLGRIRLVKEVFAAAKAANPDAVLLINDFNLSESYRILIDGLLNAGVPISAIGIQTHQHQGYMGKEKFEDILERYSVFGLPLHFTENTIISGDLMPADIVDLNDYQVSEWPSTPEGEERQRKELREIYETLFAHPLVEAITGWDFADGAWLNAPSGVVYEDGTPKPAYYELDKMINKEWHTDVTLHTDAEGFAALEGFKGEYVAAVDGLKASFDMKNNDEAVIALK